MRDWNIDTLRFGAATELGVDELGAIRDAVAADGVDAVAETAAAAEVAAGRVGADRDAVAAAPELEEDEADAADGANVAAGGAEAVRMTGKVLLATAPRFAADKSSETDRLVAGGGGCCVSANT